MSLRQLQRKHLVFLIVFGIVIISVIGVIIFFNDSSQALSAVQQQTERLLHRNPVERGEPIVITDIKVAGKKISFDQKFVADDDWLKGLVFSVKNRSNQRILALSFVLWFPRPPGSAIGSTFIMTYGNQEFRSRKPTAREQLVGIDPGEIAEIPLSSDQFERLSFFLSQVGYPRVEKVEFNINEVVFEDDTMWSGGKTVRRDKDDPAKWTQSPDLSKAEGIHSLVSRLGQLMDHRDRATDMDWLRYPFTSRDRRMFSHASFAYLPDAPCGHDVVTPQPQPSCGVAGETCSYSQTI